MTTRILMTSIVMKMVSNHLHHNHHWNRVMVRIVRCLWGVRLCERQWHCLDLRQLWSHFLAVVIIIIVIIIMIGISMRIIITTFSTLIIIAM